MRLKSSKSNLLLQIGVHVLLGGALLLLDSCSSSSKVSGPSSGSAGTGSVSMGEDVLSQNSTGKSVPELSPSEKVKSYKALADALASQNDKEVESAAAGILSYDKNDVKTLNALALYHLSKGRTQLAKMILKSILEKDPKNTGALNNLGVLALQTGELRKGMDLFKKALQYDAQFGPANANLGPIFAQGRDYEKAKNYLEVAYKSGIRDSKLLNSYAASLIGTDQSDADDITEEALKSGGDGFVPQWNRTIYLIYIKGDFKGGREALDHLALGGIPESFRPHVARMEEYMSRKK